MGSVYSQPPIRPDEIIEEMRQKLLEQLNLMERFAGFTRFHNLKNGSTSSRKGVQIERLNRSRQKVQGAETLQNT